MQRFLAKVAAVSATAGLAAGASLPAQIVQPSEPTPLSRVVDYEASRIAPLSMAGRRGRGTDGVPVVAFRAVENVAMAYVLNRMGSRLNGDSRASTLCRAVFECVRP